MVNSLNRKNLAIDDSSNNALIYEIQQSTNGKSGG